MIRRSVVNASRREKDSLRSPLGASGETGLHFRLGLVILGLKNPAAVPGNVKWEMSVRQEPRDTMMIPKSQDVGSSLRNMGWVLAAVLFLCPLAAQAQEQEDAAGKKLIAAQGMFSRGQFKFAAQEYEDFLAKYPQHPEAQSARYMLAICQYRQDDYAKAAQMLEEIVKDEKFPRRDEALAVQGHCRTMTKEYSKAKTAFEVLLATYPKSEHAEAAAFGRLQLLYLLDKKVECAAACQDCLKQYPKSGRAALALYFLGLAQSDLGKWTEATRALEDLLKNYPNTSYELDAMLLIGRALEEQAKLDLAVAQYREFLKKAPPSRLAEGNYFLGAALYRMANYGEAVKALGESLAKDAKGPYAAPARLQLGLAQLAAGQPAEARKTLADVVKNDAARAPTARYWLAQCDMADGKYEQARQTLDELAKASPPPANLAAITFDRAQCTLSLKKYEQAADEFAEFLQRYPSDKQAADALFQRAFCLHSLQKYTESQALCEQLMKGSSATQAAAAADLSVENLFLSQKYDAAAELIRKLLKDTKDEGKKLRLNFRLGQCAYLTGKNDLAIDLLGPVAENKKTAEDANLREAILFLGEAQLQAGKFADAAKTLSRYLAVSKSNKPEVKYKLAVALLRSNQNPPAEKVLAELAKDSADSPWVARALFEYGQVCYNAHQPDKAAEALTKVLAAKPPADLAAAATYLLAYIDFDAGKYSEAAGRFAQVVEKYPEHEMAAQAAFQQAVCRKESGQNQQALDLFNSYLKAHSNDKNATQARHLSAQCLARLGKHAEAVKILGELAKNKSTVSDAVLYDLAWSQRELKDKEAAKTFQRLIDDYPASRNATAAKVELADMLYKDQKYAAATGLLEKALADKGLEPRTAAIAQYRLGWCCFRQEKYDQSAVAFAAVVAGGSAPEELRPSAVYQAGLAFAAAGKSKEALEQFKALTDKYPKDVLAAAGLLKLAEVLASTGQYDKSGAANEDFLKKYPTDKLVYLAQFGRGWSLENRKQYAEARKCYEKVIEENNGVTAARAQFQIGETWFSERQFEPAARELQKVDIVYDYPEWSAKALYEAGRAFEQLGQIDQARQQYATCVKKYKDAKQDSASAALCEKRLKELEQSKSK